VDDVIVFVRLLLLPVVRNTKYHAILCEIGINAIPILLMGGMMNILETLSLTSFGKTRLLVSKVCDVK
jgi:hypothetical protein